MTIIIFWYLDIFFELIAIYFLTMLHEHNHTNMNMTSRHVTMS